MAVKGNDRTRWTEEATLLVVKAVIQIEEKGIRNRKWDRIAALLPPDFRRRTWNHRKHTFNTYVFKRLFDDILKEYRDVTRKRPTKGRSQKRLTTRVYEIMKKREELLEARIVELAENKMKSGDCSNRGSATSANLPMQVFAPIRNSPFYSNNNEGHSSREQSVSTALEQADTFSSNHATASESAEDVPLFDSSAEEIERDYINEEKIVKRLDEGCSLKSVSLDSSNQNQPAASSPLGSVSESKDSDNIAQTRSIEVRARAQARHKKWDSNSSTWLPSNLSRASLSERKLITSSSYDEDLDFTLDGLRGKLELELSRLSSWVRSRLIPVGREEVASFASRSGIKSRKLKVLKRTKPVDKLIYESLSKFTDRRVHASFQKLRSGFAKTIDDTSGELIQELLQVIPQQEDRCH